MASLSIIIGRHNSNSVLGHGGTSVNALGPGEMVPMLGNCLCYVKHQVLVVENLESKKLF